MHSWTEVSDHLHAPAALPPGKETPCWLGTGMGLDVVVKRKTPVPVEKPDPAVQPVA
jgi:hypothetical protein